MGEIVNLMSVDANRVMRLMSYVQNLWSGPFQIVLAIIFLWVTIGPSVLAGLATAIVIMPVNIVLAAWRRKYQVRVSYWNREWEWDWEWEWGSLWVCLSSVRSVGCVCLCVYLAQVKQLAEKDNRIKVVNEVLSGIKVHIHT